jgi:O-antigen/teichoic acid export membrane protein
VDGGRVMPASARAGHQGKPLSSRQQRITRGVSWSAFGVVAGKGVTVFSKVILAAMLVPEHFGMVSMVLVFMYFAHKAADLGLPLALVQRKRDRTTRLLYDSAFWSLIFVGSIFLAAVYLLGVPFVVWFYHAPELSGITALMSVGILLHNIGVVPEAILTRLGKFKAIIISECAGALVGAGAAVTLAYFGAGPWSLVAQVLVATACTAAGLLYSARWLPRLRFDASALGSLKQYSSFILGSRALLYLQQNLDYLLLGKLMGAFSLGIYSIAFLLTETLRAQIQQVVSRVIFPVYSRMHHDAQKLGTIYCGTIRYMTVIMFPISMLLILYAHKLIPFLFKHAWLPAIGPSRILAVASIVVASSGTAGDVLKAIGKPNLDFSINLKVTALVAFPALWLGIVALGVDGAAWAVVVYCLAARMMLYFAIRREIEVGLFDILKACGPALAGCILMVLCSILLQYANWMIAAAASCAAYLIAVIPVVHELYSIHRSNGKRGSIAGNRIVAFPEANGTDEPGFSRGLEIKASGLRGRLHRVIAKHGAIRMRLRRWFGPVRAALKFLHLAQPTPNRRFLPPSMTVRDFFHHLDERGIEYVVLRWFEDLPTLDRDHDLDLLVADHCVESLLSELSQWPIGHPIDIYSETGISGTTYAVGNGALGKVAHIPVFPPELARGILQRRRRHADLCYVPNPQDHFYSLAYHAIYLKSTLPETCCDASCDEHGPGMHDYVEALRTLGARIGIDLSGEVTRTRVANVLAERGWRPSRAQ